MIWLAAEMWMLLLIAFLLGAGGAVWILSARKRSDSSVRSETDDLGEAGVRAAAPGLLLDSPDGQKDDLTQIIGIDPKTETRLNSLGVFHIRQIASWDDSAARWIEIRLNEPGRVARERWTEQAAAIA